MPVPFRSIIRLEIKPGHNAEFEKLFMDAGMLSRPKQIDAMFEGALMRSTVEPHVYSVVANWSSPEAYAEWQRTSQQGVDAKAMARLNEILVDPIPGILFEVAATSND